MPFNFELTFTGLCALIYKIDPNKKPTFAAVVLTKADQHHGHHKHLPLMSYNPKDLASGSTVKGKHRLVPNPQGNDIAVLDLAGRVKVGDPTAGGFSASWAKSGQKPAPGEETSLAWLPPIYTINQNAAGLPRPDLTKPNHGLVGEIATVELTGGKLEAVDLTQKQSADYMRAEFVYANGSGGSTDTQVLADKLRVTISGLTQPLVIDGAGWTAKLRPAPLPGNVGGTGRVEMSITNLPDLTAPTSELRLTHFDHYYDMFDWTTKPRPPFRLPKLEGYPVTGSSVVCPPGRYDG